MKYASTWNRLSLWEICKLLWILYKHQIQVTTLLSYITIRLKVAHEKEFRMYDNWTEKFRIYSCLCKRMIRKVEHDGETSQEYKIFFNRNYFDVKM